MLKLINQFPENETFSYAKRIKLLRDRKISQTEEKARLGGLDEDDYGHIVQNEFEYKLVPNHPNGSIYGYEGWSTNYCRLLSLHPLYCDPLDAFVGKNLLFMERLRPEWGLWNPKYPYDELQKIFDQYNIISGIGNMHHFTPDLQIGLDLGWGGILQKLKEQKLLHDASHNEFYDAEIAVVEAIIAFLKRMSAELRELSEEERNPYLKNNLVEMAEINEKMADQRPETFREAIQWMCWFSMLSRTYNRGSAGGPLEVMLRPYYEQDILTGRLTDEEAVFYLACLFLQDSRYFQIGGSDSNGNDQITHFSYLILEAADMINVACNLTICVNDNIDPEFFKKSVAYLFKNKQGWPRYLSEKNMTEGFMRNGYSIELARKRAAAGCHWSCIPGMEYTMADTVKINLAKVFEVAYTDMMAHCSCPDIEALWDLFAKHLGIAVNATGDGIMHHLRYQTKNQPELILNLFQHGLIEKGVNITDGGANFYNIGIDGSGLAVAADSFAACHQRVEIEKRITYEELTRHMSENYEGKDGEYIRQMMLSSQRYGGGDTLGDQWAVRINELFTRLVRSLMEKNKGIVFIPGYFSWSNTIAMGKTVGATPNGRRAHDVINHGANPLGGFRKDGAVTSMCNTIASIQPNYGNTAPVQLELDPGIANDEEGIEKMCSMIRTILSTGNTLLNINIIDAKKILEAHEDPYKYPDLVVRVTGFTAFFSMLSPEFRQLVVDRVIAVNGDKI